MRAASAICSLGTALLFGCVEPNSTACGDGFHDPGEQCDDGNRIGGDGCDPTCAFECGNGQPDPGEECDDGNRDTGDGCDTDCMNECGNEWLDPGEECDYTLTSDCDETCHRIDGSDGDADADTDADADADTDADADIDPGSCDLEVAPSGGSVTRTDELTTTSPTWHRPIGACTSLTSLAESFPMEACLLRNGLGSAATVSIDVLSEASAAGTLPDPLVFIYEGSSVPADPLECLAGDDDSGEGREPRIEGAVLEAAGRYLVVVTTFSDDADRAFGSYRLVISTE